MAARTGACRCLALLYTKCGTPCEACRVAVLALFFMNILSFAVTEELLPAGLSSALAIPARLNAAIIKERMQNCETTMILVFMAFLRLKQAGKPRQLRIANRCLLGR